MEKIFGLTKDYGPMRSDATRVVICYGRESVDNEHSTWYEVYLPKKQNTLVGINEVKEAIIADINAQTDEKILSGFVWDNISVWLSAENQRNFSEAQRMAEKYGSSVLPLTFKLGETGDGTPVYHTFETVEELDGFYTQAFSYVNQCLTEGWQRKDAIDWTPYEALFPNAEQPAES